jgi:hypothetical protein
LSAARSEALLRLGFVADPAVAEAAARLSGSALLARLRAARVRLEDGALEAAWPDFAWRGRDPDAPGIAARMPYGPLEKPNPTTWRGLRVLCFGELGHGDMIQCLRYVPMVLAAGARVVLELQPGLVRLARSIPGVAAVVGWGEEVPPHDLALPMFHLPWAFGTTLATIPAGVPYLGADAAEIASWRARLAALPGMKLGLVWAGEPRRGSEFEAMDARRSLPLAALAPLGAVADVSLVSLQLGTAAAQIVPSGLALHDWTGELSDFAATAALMEALDLVITVDTAAAHLAGALGRKVWLLNRHDSCWRWLRDREDSPWYPTMRIFRQTAPGEWGPVVQRVAAALQEESGSLLKKRTKKLLTLDAGRLDPSASNE